MNYKDFTDVLHHENIDPNNWEHYLIMMNQSTTKQEILDLIISDCPNLLNILIEGRNHQWCTMLPKGSYLSESFPGKVTKISIPTEETV